MPVCLLRRERKSVDLNGRVVREGLGGNGERENTIRIYCLKKISVKNIEKKRNTLNFKNITNSVKYLK